MKVMTFNTQHCLNFIEQKIDFQIMADAISIEKPDIVGLNEMRDSGPSDDFQAQVKILSELTGMEYYYFAKAIEWDGNPYGNGFISKIPIISVETIPVPDPEIKGYYGYYETRCLLKAVLENGITVLVIHFGLNPDEQINAVNTVLEHITDKKCILMGDFNIEPDNEILNPIREKMFDTADLIKGNILTFPSDKPDRKIDYIFVSPDFTVKSAEIPETVASDHRAHTTIIEE